MLAIQASLTDIYYEGVTHCEVLATRPVGIVRVKGVDPWEAELLLVKSNWSAPSSLDIQSLNTDEQAKYYVFKLPIQGHPRPTGKTPVAVYWLTSGTSFTSLEEARDAFDR